MTDEPDRVCALSCQRLQPGGFGTATGHQTAHARILLVRFVYRSDEDVDALLRSQARDEDRNESVRWNVELGAD